MLALSCFIHEIRQQKIRLLLTLIAIAWGTASITGMLAVGEGLRQSFGQAMRNVGKNLLVLSPATTTLHYQGHLKHQNVYFESTWRKSLEKHVPDIQSWIGEHEFDDLPLFHQRQKAPYYSGRAVTPAYQSLRTITLESGRFITPKDMETRAHVVVLGHQIAQWLFPKNPHPVGEKVILDHWIFTVIGVAQRKLQFSSYGAPDSYLIWIPNTTYRLLGGNNREQYWLFQTQHPANNAHIAQDIRQRLALTQGFSPSDEPAVEVTDFYQEQQKTDALFRGLDVFLGIIGSLTLLVASMGVANVMLITVKQSTRQIGIQIALGARDWHILCRYLLESCVITLLGGVLGIAGAAGMIAVAQHLPMNPDLLHFINRPDPKLSYPIVGVTVSLLFLAGLAAGYLPARQAARVEPVVALRSL